MQSRGYSARLIIEQLIGPLKHHKIKHACHQQISRNLYTRVRFIQLSDRIEIVP